MSCIDIPSAITNFGTTIYMVGSVASLTTCVDPIENSALMSNMATIGIQFKVIAIFGNPPLIKFAAAT